MKNALFGLLGLLCLSASAAQAPISTRLEPCRWWQYSTATSGYTCRSLERRIEIYQARDVDQLISALEKRIQALEARIATLEAKP